MFEFGDNKFTTFIGMFFVSILSITVSAGVLWGLATILKETKPFFIENLGTYGGIVAMFFIVFVVISLVFSYMMVYKTEGRKNYD